MSSRLLSKILKIKIYKTIILPVVLNGCEAWSLILRKECRLSGCHLFLSPHAGWSSAPVLFSLYVNDIPTPSRHIELAQYSDDTALVATSKLPSLLVKYLETHCLNWKYGSENGRLRLMSGRVQAYSLRLDEFRYLVLSGFSEKRFDREKKSNIWGSPPIGDLPGLVI